MASGNRGFLNFANFLWFKIAGVLTIVLSGIFIVLALKPEFRIQHSGGGVYGMTLGIVGAILILWLSFLGIRKRRVTPGQSSLRGWLSAHVYLGLALIVIVTLHTGFKFGMNVHTLAYCLMLLTVFSGVVGVFCYSALPRIMSDNRSEMTQTQMIAVIRSFDIRLQSLALPLEERFASALRQSNDFLELAKSDNRAAAYQLNVGGIQKAITLWNSMKPTVRKEDLQAFDQIGNLLAQKKQIALQLRRHIQYMSWLRGWLYLHIPATIALIAAVTVHIVSVFFYS